MFGIDISNIQSSIDFTKDKLDFVIMKATEGIGFYDKSMVNFYYKIPQHILIGFYHFARPDLRKTIEGMKLEAIYFLEMVKPYLKEGLLILDWEPNEATYVHNTQMVLMWLDTVKKETGITPLIYCNTSTYTGLLNNDKENKLKKYPWWAASWGKNNGYFEASKMPVGAAIWQYTSRGKILGFNERIDLDFSDRDHEWWQIMSKGEEELKEKLSDEMKWAIEKGYFKGYLDKTYRPDDLVTRDQLARILYRYNKDIEQDS